MAKVRDVAAEEIKQIDQLFESSGKTFKCTENKHAWEGVKGGGDRPTDRVCKKCGKRYRYPKYLGQRERNELYTRRERMGEIIKSEEQNNSGHTK